MLRVIEETCRKKKARLYRIGREITVAGRTSQPVPIGRQANRQTGRRADVSLIFQTFNVRGIQGRYENLKISLLGKHQLLNAACAIGAVELLRPQIPITKGQIREAIAKTQWPGRLEIKPFTVHYSPFTVILDGAHNVAGAKVLKEAIRDYFDYEKLILILGILRDKDVEGIVEQLVPLASWIIVTKPQTPRAIEPEGIARIAKRYSGSVVIKEKVSQAIACALSYAKKRDMILITGSLYTVGEAKTYLKGLKTYRQSLCDRT